VFELRGELRPRSHEVAVAQREGVIRPQARLQQDPIAFERDAGLETGGREPDLVGRGQLDDVCQSWGSAFHEHGMLLCLGSGVVRFRRAPVPHRERVDTLVQVVTVAVAEAEGDQLGRQGRGDGGDIPATLMRSAVAAMARVMAVASKRFVAAANSFHNGGSVAAEAEWVRRKSISKDGPHFPSGVVLASSRRWASVSARADLCSDTSSLMARAT
jgi:hypothetical protein